jgi:sec-independent protein translocase protein TatA
MPSIGPLEVVIVLIIALIIFGPRRLPELGRSLGRGIREFRSSVTGNNGAARRQAALEEQTDGDDEEAVEGEVMGDNGA